jgi:hypothetical protein
LDWEGEEVTYLNTTLIGLLALSCLLQWVAIILLVGKYQSIPDEVRKHAIRIIYKKEEKK